MKAMADCITIQSIKSQYHIMPAKLFISLIICFLVCNPFNKSLAEKFNTNKIIIKSGNTTELADDEGYLFLRVHTDIDVSKIRIKALNRGKNLSFTDLRVGENHALLKVKAGDYYWDFFNVSKGFLYLRKRFEKNDFKFTVKPGVVNYPGAWPIKKVPYSLYMPYIYLSNENHLSNDIARFKKQFPQLNHIPFEYRGENEDHYANYLSQAISDYQGDTLPELLYLRNNKEQLPMTLIGDELDISDINKRYPKLKLYYSQNRTQANGISPQGHFMLFTAYQENKIILGMVNINNYDVSILLNKELPKKTFVKNYSWVDKDTLFITLSLGNKESHYVSHLTINKKMQITNATFVPFQYSGLLVDSLIQQDNDILFFASANDRMSKKNNLFKVDVSNDDSIAKSFRKIHEPTKELEDIIEWLSDKNGAIRAAVSYKQNKDDEELFTYWYLSDPKSNQWIELKTIKGTENKINLVYLSPEDDYFLALTNQYSDKMSLHKYSTSDFKHLGVYLDAYEHEIQSIIVDQTNHQVIGHTSIENGRLTNTYYNPDDDILKSAKSANPDLNLYKVQEIPDSNKVVIYGDSPSNDGAWYILNTTTNKVDKLFDHNPEFEKQKKGYHHLIKARADDGITIEGYLILPEQQGTTQYPLVVMPHGGPIGVRDYAYNDTMQHFFAANGVASLKVNYRGSDGFGKNFSKLGKQQWGQKIEQDIYAAIQKTLADHPIDKSKICTLGGSYGGYSSIMMAYLYPDLIKCAVSIAGVMDLPLVFTAHALSEDQEEYQTLVEIIGDPKTDLTQLVEKSPLYLLDKIKQPLLFFQGVKDTRVTVEQIIRTQQIISLKKLDHDVILFDNEGHSLSQQANKLYFVSRSLDFIKKHLNAE